MTIVVEGPDGAGKTNLAERLRDDLHLPIQPKVVSSDAKPLVDLKDWVNEANEQMKKRKMSRIPVIYDRHRLVSELIYGPILRSELEEGFEDLEWLSGSLIEFYSLRPILICALPPWATVLGNISATKQPTQVIQNWQQIYWSYHCWVAHHRRQVTVWDYTADHYDDLLKEVKFRLGSDWNWREKKVRTG